jgi:hypothetical protein
VTILSSVTSLDDYADEQRRVCERFGAAFDPPARSTKVGFALKSKGKSPIYGTRHPLVGNTNGWYIWCGERSDAADFYQPLHTEHLPKHCPLALPFLALPPGWGFITDSEGYVDVWFNAAFLAP